MSITVYCVMPHHLHLLVNGITVESDLRAFVNAAKQCSSWEFRQRAQGRLWQDGYYERVLREHETGCAVARHIVNNPVRAGFVRHPLDYPFWGSQSHSRAQVLEYIASCQEEDVGRPW